MTFKDYIVAACWPIFPIATFLYRSSTLIDDLPIQVEPAPIIGNKIELDLIVVLQICLKRGRCKSPTLERQREDERLNIVRTIPPFQVSNGS